MTRKRWFVIGFLALCAGGIWWWTQQAADVNADADVIETEVVARGDLVVRVAATGTVEPNFKLEVKSKASGEVLSFPFEAGDRVKAGQLMVELDPTDEQRNVRLAQAELDVMAASLAAAQTNLERERLESKLRAQEANAQHSSAEAELETAEARLQRTTDLFAKRLVKPEDLEAAQLAVAAARSGVDLSHAAVDRAKLSAFSIKGQEQEVTLRRANHVKSEIALEQARDRLRDARIAAPIDGVLLNKAVERGQIIASGITSASGGTALATIADMSRVFVIAAVDEADVGRVASGQSVEITSDAFPKLTLIGTVERVLPEAVEESNVTFFHVRIEVKGKGRELLLPGMTTNVELTVAHAADSLLVSNRALQAREDRLGLEVVHADGSHTWHEVQIGLTDGETTAVIGVNEGEAVLLGAVRARGDARGRGGRMFFGIGQKKPETKKRLRAPEVKADASKQAPAHP